MHEVFVYGTLKRGGSNHAHLEGQSFLGPARTVAGCVLYGLDGYPGMVREDGAESVSGELWSVADDCLERLDALEGTAEGLYRRGPVRLQAPWDATRPQTYFYLRSLEGRPRIGSAWPG